MFSASKSLFKITEFFRHREDSLARLPLYAIFWYLVRLFYFGGCCCHDHMVVEFTTTYAISAYHHWCWGRISIRSRCTTLCDKVCQWFATGQWFSPGPPVSSTNKTDCHDITEILLKVALITTKQTRISKKQSATTTNLVCYALLDKWKYINLVVAL